MHRDPLESLLEDLEQQAEGLALGSRDEELAERAREEYAEVDLLGRLHGSVGGPVVLRLAGGGEVVGVLARAGAGWVGVRGPRGEVLVALAAVVGVRGLGDHAVPEAARPVQARLRLTACLRRLAEEGTTYLLRRTDGTVVRGVLGRVGADFVEVLDEAGTEVVPLRQVVTVAPGD